MVPPSRQFQILVVNRRCSSGNINPAKPVNPDILSLTEIVFAKNTSDGAKLWRVES